MAISPNGTVKDAWAMLKVAQSFGTVSGNGTAW